MTDGDRILASLSDKRLLSERSRLEALEQEIKNSLGEIKSEQMWRWANPKNVERG